ncbi:IS5 family transposase [Streptomyces viridifaciens]|nr:IS5 family transposase [Streptomyces viridifaciens]
MVGSVARRAPRSSTGHRWIRATRSGWWPDRHRRLVSPQDFDVCLLRGCVEWADSHQARTSWGRPSIECSHRSATSPFLKGGWARGTPRRDAVAEPCRPPGGGGAGGEGLGRSRGGFTSKVHLSADGCCRPLSLVVTPGQRADCTQFIAVLEKIRVPRIGRGRPRKKPDSLAADKAYSNGPCRDFLRRRGIRHTIPEKTDSQAARLRKGSRGGRPPGFDEDRYKKRNTVERAIDKLKNSRAVATRYDKRGYVYLGTVTAAALVIWLRT